MLIIHTLFFIILNNLILYKKISVIISLFILALAIYIFIESFLNKRNNEVEQSKEMIQYIVNTAEQNQKKILYNPLLNQLCYFGKDSTKLVMLKEICDTNKIFFYFQTNASNRFEKIQIEGEVI